MDTCKTCGTAPAVEGQEVCETCSSQPQEETATAEQQS